MSCGMCPCQCSGEHNAGRRHGPSIDATQEAAEGLSNSSVCTQATYDKLETKNLYSPHFGECRFGKIELTQDADSDLMIGRDAANYEVRPSLHIVKACCVCHVLA